MPGYTVKGHTGVKSAYRPKYLDLKNRESDLVSRQKHDDKEVTTNTQTDTFFQPMINDFIERIYKQTGDMEGEQCQGAEEMGQGETVKGVGEKLRRCLATPKAEKLI